MRDALDGGAAVVARETEVLSVCVKESVFVCKTDPGDDVVTVGDCVDNADGDPVAVGDVACDCVPEALEPGLRICDGDWDMVVAGDFVTLAVGVLERLAVPDTVIDTEHVGLEVMVDEIEGVLDSVWLNDGVNVRLGDWVVDSESEEVTTCVDDCDNVGVTEIDLVTADEDEGDCEAVGEDERVKLRVDEELGVCDEPLDAAMVIDKDWDALGLDDALDVIDCDVVAVVLYRCDGVDDWETVELKEGLHEDVREVVEEVDLDGEDVTVAVDDCVTLPD